MTKQGFYISILVGEDVASQMSHKTRFKYTIETFSEPVQLLRSVKEKPCNLLIIEVNHPEFNGFDVKKQAKKIVSSANLIFVSKKRDLATVSSCQRHGADYLFFTPLDRDKFFDAISILSRRRQYWMDLMKEIKE